MPESPELPAPSDDEALSTALARLDLGADVPPALQQAAAAALAWVDRLGRDAAGAGGPGTPSSSVRRPR